MAAVDGAAKRTLGRRASRDAAVLALTGCLWAADAAGLAAGRPWLAASVGVAAGLATALSAFVLHEWGHLAGALAGGAVVSPNPGLGALFLFRFDTRRSGRRAFLAMSYGGFTASGAVIGVLALALPLDRVSGWVAGAAVAAGIVATAVLEIPVARRVARGGPLPSEGAVYLATDAR